MRQHPLLAGASLSASSAVTQLQNYLSAKAAKLKTVSRFVQCQHPLSTAGMLSKIMSRVAAELSRPSAAAAAASRLKSPQGGGTQQQNQQSVAESASARSQVTSHKKPSHGRRRCRVEPQLRQLLHDSCLQPHSAQCASCSCRGCFRACLASPDFLASQTH